MDVHEIKDLMMIYDDCDDYKVIIWDPVTQKKYNLLFTGSNNVDKTINFNIHEVENDKNSIKRIELLNKIITLNREIKSLNEIRENLENDLNNLDKVL